jgi:hypothetical protein
VKTFCFGCGVFFSCARCNANIYLNCQGPDENGMYLCNECKTEEFELNHALAVETQMLEEN